MNKHFIRFFVGFVKVTGFLPMLLFYKPRVHLQKNASRRLPRPCILVSNHCSLLDFPLYLLLFPFRTVRFLMAEVLFNKGKFFAFFLRSIGGIRVDRDAKSFDFVPDAIDLLMDGQTLGIFPEGRLPVDGKHFPFTASTAIIALYGDAPIVPVYTDGSYGLFKRTNVVIGAPICLNDHALDTNNEGAQFAHLTKFLEETVYSLANELK